MEDGTVFMEDLPNSTLSWSLKNENSISAANTKGNKNRKWQFSIATFAQCWESPGVYHTFAASQYYELFNIFLNTEHLGLIDFVTIDLKAQESWIILCLVYHELSKTTSTQIK